MGLDVFFAKEFPDPEQHLLAHYRIESDEPIERAAMKIAAEESIGTWTEVKTITTRVRRDLAAKVYNVKGRMASIAFPIELFDVQIGGIPSILSIVAGNLFGLRALRAVRLMDLEFPPDVVSHFKGPKFGVEGVRRMLGTDRDRRPHLGTIVKPKVGLTPRETANVAYEAALGGVDMIKDDETLVNQKFCPLWDRLHEVMEALDKATEETGRKIFYALNITTGADRITDVAEKALENGANMLMVDIITAGFPSLQALAEDPSIDVPLHAHRAMHAAMTRNREHGIHMNVLAKLARLAGADQLHTGTAAGKMGEENEVAEISRINEMLRAPMNGLKPVLPAASGGIHPGLVPENVEALGRDIVLNAGGGIHGHPRGTRAGARAMRQAIDAHMMGASLSDYAEKHVELREALQLWGTRQDYRYA